MWTVRESVQGVGGQWTLLDLDSVSVAGGTYPVTVSWAGFCSGINQGILAALIGAPKVAQQNLLQSSVATPINTFSITYPQNTQPGSLLILAAAFAAGTFIAYGTTVTDDQGNTWSLITQTNAASDFQPAFMQLWAATNASSNKPTVTLHYDGTHQIETITLVVTEYLGASLFGVQSSNGRGPLFGTGSPVNLSVTIPGEALLIAVAATNQPCVNGTSVSGGGETFVPSFSIPGVTSPLLFSPIPINQIPFVRLPFGVSATRKRKETCHLYRYL